MMLNRCGALARDTKHLVDGAGDLVSCQHTTQAVRTRLRLPKTLHHREAGRSWCYDVFLANQARTTGFALLYNIIQNGAKAVPMQMPMIRSMKISSEDGNTPSTVFTPELRKTVSLRDQKPVAGPPSASTYRMESERNPTLLMANPRPVQVPQRRRQLPLW